MPKVKPKRNQNYELALSEVILEDYMSSYNIHQLPNRFSGINIIFIIIIKKKNCAQRCAQHFLKFNSFVRFVRFVRFVHKKKKLLSKLGIHFRIEALSFNKVVKTLLRQ
jgi:hypothetical protein